MRAHGSLSLDELRAAVAAGRLDTVLLCLTDMQGRLQGKRLTARHFLDEVVEHGAEACNYLLAVDVEMNTVDGYAMSSWETGYGDFAMKPDFDTLRLVPWHDGTALCMADIAWDDGSAVVASPRQILRAPARPARRARLERLRRHRARVHRLPRHLRRGGAAQGYRDLTPANLYNVDYSMLGTARVEPLIRPHPQRDGRRGPARRDSKGECNFGQHEINFPYGPALRTADEHTIYKNGAKEIAAQEGMAITFMAKFDEREGNSCHIHLSLPARRRHALFADEPERSSASSPASSRACAS